MVPQVNEFSWLLSYFLIWTFLFFHILCLNFFFNLSESIETNIVKFNFNFMV